MLSDGISRIVKPKSAESETRRQADRPLIRPAAVHMSYRKRPRRNGVIHFRLVLYLLASFTVEYTRTSNSLFPFSVTNPNLMIDPYNAQVIPERDLYTDSCLYGRYKAAPGDFDPADKTPQEILNMCHPDNEMMSTFTEGRTIYAIGRVIVKAADVKGRSHELGDANDAAAITLVTKHFPWIPVPTIFFQGKVLHPCVVQAKHI